MSLYKCKGLAIFSVCCCIFVACIAQDMIAKGLWVVENVSKCPDADKYPYNFTLRKKKLNRTHDAFDIAIDLPEEINEYNTGVLIDCCIKVDGGCKPVQVFSETSLCQFLMKYAEVNFKRGLTSAGLGEGCPIPKGYFEINDFMFDNTELPEDGMLGNFKADIYVLKQEEKIGCFVAHARFQPLD